MHFPGAATPAIGVSPTAATCRATEHTLCGFPNMETHLRHAPLNILSQLYVMLVSFKKMCMYVCVCVCVRKRVCVSRGRQQLCSRSTLSLFVAFHPWVTSILLKNQQPALPLHLPSLPTVQLFSIRSPSLASYLSFGIAITFFFIFVIGEACARCRLYLTSCSVLVGIYWFLCLSSTGKNNRVLLG